MYAVLNPSLYVLGGFSRISGLVRLRALQTGAGLCNPDVDLSSQNPSLYR